MSGVTVRTRIYIFYSILIPFSILACVFLIIAIPWSIALINSCTDGDCVNLVRIAILNLILSAFVVGCGVVTHPFIWYMVRSVTRNRLHEYIQGESVDTRSRDRSIRDRSLQDASLLADGYSLRD